MSTTTPQSDPAPSPHSVARDLTDLFDIVIVQNPEACATCHAKIRDRQEIDTEQAHDGLGTGNVPTETLVRVHDGDVGYDVEIKGGHGAQRQHVTRTCCAECGQFAGRTPNDPVSKRTMLGRIPALADRLADHGLDIDTDTVRRTVHHCKGSAEYDNRDDDIWRAAVALGVRDAYR